MLPGCFAKERDRKHLFKYATLIAVKYVSVAVTWVTWLALQTNVPTCNFDLTIVASVLTVGRNDDFLTVAASLLPQALKVHRVYVLLYGSLNSSWRTCTPQHSRAYEVMLNVAKIAPSHFINLCSSLSLVYFFNIDNAHNSASVDAVETVAGS